MADLNNLPADLDWSFITANDVTMVVNIQDSAGNAIDITGYTYTAAIAMSDGTSVTVSAAITDAANGEVTLTVTEANNTATGVGNWYLDEEDTSSNLVTLLSGQVRISAKGTGGA